MLLSDYYPTRLRPVITLLQPTKNPQRPTTAAAADEEEREEINGESIGASGDPFREPADQAPAPKPSIRLDPRIRAEDDPLRLEDRDPASPRVPLRLRDRRRPNPQHGGQEEEAGRVPGRQARLQEGLRYVEEPALDLAGAVPDPVVPGGDAAEALWEEDEGAAGGGGGRGRG